ncbi:Ig-like domain-containing protein [Pedobacter sp. SYP-B3415]|uniref:Ig-like domain-containing protein n=1 Tax=Pedobacter sp. SYP-B3415 TaxID=2496641 RepID=UPI00351265A7
MLLLGCASMQAPQGGPRDEKAPKVVRMEPKDLTTNFNAERVVIEFDEYFKLQNQFKEFSVSPELEKPPILRIRGRRLEILFQDSLEKNTTYTLNFGKAIGDVNEGNTVNNLTYVFSTGSKLDSLSISGKVTEALTGEPPKEALVFILPLNRDTVFGKGKPSIFTTTDSSGNFKLRNLRADTYKIYAIKEQENGGDKVYQQLNDQVAFIKDPVKLDKNIDSIRLQLFKENADVLRVLERKINSDGSILITVNRQLKKPALTITDPAALDARKLTRFNRTNDSARVWLTNMDFDSVAIALVDTGKVLQNIRLTKSRNAKYERNLQASDNLSGGKLNFYRQLELTFNFPITSADASKITLQEDSTRRANFQLQRDSADFLKYRISYPWRTKRKYTIRFAEGAFTAIFNTQNKAFSKTFELEPKDSYGTLSLSVQIPDTSRNYIVQLVDEKKENVLREDVLNRNKTILYANYEARNYFVRIVYDRNRNGVWDTGNVKLGIQPERIFQVEKEMSIRANWDRNETLVVPPESP